jgi:hypothetical protein
MKFHNTILEEEQLAILRLAGGLLAQMGFYLAGGTALALQLGHRRSVDLDWFTTQRMADPLVWAQRLRDDGIPIVNAQTAPGTLHGQAQGVRMSLFEFRYPLLQPLELWQAGGAQLASLDDIGCMKLSAIAQRGSRKDFYDFYALCLSHRPLKDFLQLYREKFGVEDISPVLYGLVYFTDAEAETDILMIRPVSWKTVKKAFRQWVKDIAGDTSR